MTVLPVYPNIVRPVGLDFYDSALSTSRQLSVCCPRYPRKREQNGEEQLDHSLGGDVGRHDVGQAAGAHQERTGETLTLRGFDDVADAEHGVPGQAGLVVG